MVGAIEIMTPSRWKHDSTSAPIRFRISSAKRRSGLTVWSLCVFVDAGCSHPVITDSDQAFCGHKHFKINFKIISGSDCVSATKPFRPILAQSKRVAPSFVPICGSDCVSATEHGETPPNTKPCSPGSHSKACKEPSLRSNFIP